MIEQLIMEMDSEQLRFDTLSEKLDKIKDQASSEFRSVSSDLIKSQNKLALLMNRNMYCFNMVCMCVCMCVCLYM